MMQADSDERKFRGYAGIVRNTLSPLNENPVFLRRYGRAAWRFVCNSFYWQYAALIIIAEGALRVDAVANEPKSNLYKKSLHWDGFVEMDSALFVAVMTQQLSFFGIMRQWLAGHAKLKGLVNLLILWDLFCILLKHRQMSDRNKL